TLSKADLSLKLGLNLLDLKHDPKLNFNSELEFNADKLLHKTSTLHLVFQPQGQLSLNGNLSELSKPLESLYFEFEQNFLIERFELQQQREEKGKVETTRLAKQQAVFSGEYKKGHIQLQGELVQQQLQLPQLKKWVNTKQLVHLSSDVALTKPQLEIQFFLQDQQLLALNISAENTENSLMLKPDLMLYVRQNLLAYSDLAKPLDQFGGQKIELQAEVKLQHQQQNIQSADFSRFMQWPASVEGQMSLTQLSQPKQKNSSIYKQPINVSFFLKKEGRYQVEWQLKAPQLKLAELKRAIALEWQNSSEFQWPLQQSSIKGSLSLDQNPVLSYQLELSDLEKEAKISATLDLTLDPKWRRYHSSLAQLDQLGRSDFNWNLHATLQHRKPNLLSLLAEDLSQGQIQLQSNIRVKQRSRGTLLQFKQPLELKQQLNWSGRGLELASQFTAGHLKVNNLFKTKNVQAQLQLATDVVPIPKKAQLTLTADAESLIFKDGFETAALLFPVRLSAKGRQTGQQLVLDELNLNLSKKLLQLEMSANFNSQNKSGQASGLLQSYLRPHLLHQPALSGAGRVALPWQLSLEEGQRASLEAEMTFTDFALSLDQMALNNINGSLKIAEELQLNDDSTVGFRYLLHVDPFQRVDYSRVQPQLLSRQNLSIERVQQGRYQAGPLHASLGLEQNLLQLQQFDLALYGGFITGQFYLDATPGNWKIGLLSRLSQINLQPLLAEDSVYKDSPQNPISARTALEFDLKRRLLEGRVDISDISREQLLQLLELFDPNYEDEQLAKIRAAVQIAYPEWLALKMQKGLLDLELSLSLIPGTLRVQNLPLSPILERFAGEALNHIEALPLQ
ncbi:MAG: hypothetical protein Q9N68_06250, partial [Gammaproteobacteria bacterium]|nr:hypothetical protein [Gammaproteobacteria bacterium]